MIAKLVPVVPEPAREMPDFLGRMKRIHGDVILRPSNAALLAQEGERFVVSLYIPDDRSSDAAARILNLP